MTTRADLSWPAVVANLLGISFVGAVSTSPGTNLMTLAALFSFVALVCGFVVSVFWLVHGKWKTPVFRRSFVVTAWVTMTLLAIGWW